MCDNFNMSCTGHVKDARELLLKKKIVKADALARMNDREVEEVIKENYKTFEVGEDWLLVPNDSYEKFCKLIIWICR